MKIKRACITFHYTRDSAERTFKVLFELDLCEQNIFVLSLYDCDK